MHVDVYKQEKHVEASCIIPYYTYIRSRTTVDFTSESQSLLFIVRQRGDRNTRVLSRALPYNGRTVRIFSFPSPPTESTLYIYDVYIAEFCVVHHHVVRQNDQTIILFLRSILNF